MKRLFWRILALLLSAFSITIVIGYFLFQWISHEIKPGDAVILENTRAIAEQLVVAVEREKSRRFRHDLRRQYDMHGWVLDMSGRTLGRRPVPRELLQQVQHYPSVIRPGDNTEGRFYIYAHELESKETGQQYRVVLSSPTPPNPGARNGWMLMVPIIVFILGIIAASVLLSKWILRPLRIFSQTAQSLSPDNLTARIPDTVSHRADAFGSLARDFNIMAGRVERAVENQRQLLRDVSHELRTPLTRIQLASSLSARKSGNTAELERIDEEVEKLDFMIEDLITLSRTESQPLTEKSPLDLRVLLESIIDDVNFEYQESGKMTKLAIPGGLQVPANQGMLNQALENIIRNAMRHTAEQSVVQVSVARENKGAIITVVDQGTGIPEKYLDRIFDPFFRIDMSRSAKGEQHGIGLALTRSIIHAHDGWIRAENIEPRGLCVTVFLPG